MQCKAALKLGRRERHGVVLEWIYFEQSSLPGSRPQAREKPCGHDSPYWICARNPGLRSAEKYLEEICALGESISLECSKRNQCEGSLSVASSSGSLPGVLYTVAWPQVQKCLFIVLGASEESARRQLPGEGVFEIGVLSEPPPKCRVLRFRAARPLEAPCSSVAKEALAHCYHILRDASTFHRELRSMSLGMKASGNGFGRRRWHSASFSFQTHHTGEVIVCRPIRLSLCAEGGVYICCASESTDSSNICKERLPLVKSDGFPTANSHDAGQAAPSCGSERECRRGPKRSSGTRGHAVAVLYVVLSSHLLDRRLHSRARTIPPLAEGTGFWDTCHWYAVHALTESRILWLCPLGSYAALEQRSGKCRVLLCIASTT